MGAEKPVGLNPHKLGKVTVKGNTYSVLNTIDDTNLRATHLSTVMKEQRNILWQFKQWVLMGFGEGEAMWVELS